MLLIHLLSHISQFWKILSPDPCTQHLRVLLTAPPSSLSLIPVHSGVLENLSQNSVTALWWPSLLPSPGLDHCSLLAGVLVFIFPICCMSELSANSWNHPANSRWDAQTLVEAHLSEAASQSGWCTAGSTYTLIASPAQALILWPHLVNHPSLFTTSSGTFLPWDLSSASSVLLPQILSQPLSACFTLTWIH